MKTLLQMEMYYVREYTRTCRSITELLTTDMFLPEKMKLRLFCREPHIDYLYQLTNHLDLQLQRRRFLKFQPIRYKNCPWWPCFCRIKMK